MQRFLRNLIYREWRKGALPRHLNFLDFVENSYETPGVVEGIEDDDAIFQWILGRYRGKYRKGIEHRISVSDYSFSCPAEAV